MQRKKLLDLPIVRTVNGVPDVPIEDKEKYKFAESLCYRARVDTSTGEEVLIIDFYRPQSNDFVKRLFVCDGKWMTEYANGSVSDASLLIGRYYYQNYYYVPFGEPDEEKIKAFMKTMPTFKKYEHSSYQFSKHSGIEVVSHYQDIIREERLENKYQKIRDSVSREMLEIHPTPDKIKKWISDAVMPHYLFYVYSKANRVTASCSHCGETVEIDRPRSGDTVKCPHCKMKCTAKAFKAYANSNGFSDSAKVLYVQPLKNNRICLRQYQIEFGYHGGSMVPHRFIREEQRNFAVIRGNEIKGESSYVADSNYRGGEWRTNSVYYYSVTEKAYIYPSNLNQILKKREEFCQYHIDYNKIARCCNPLDLRKLINASVGVESLMNLVNNRLFNMARGVIGMADKTTVDVDDELKAVSYQNCGALRKAFGITKDDLPFLRAIDPTPEEFDCYVMLKNSGKRSAAKELKEYFAVGRELEDIKKLTAHIVRHSSVYQFVKFYKRLDAERFFNGGNPKKYFLKDYFDYIGFAKLLEADLHDLKVLYPQNPKKAHDEFAAIVNSKEFSSGELPQIARQHEKYNQMFGYAYKGLLIVPPKRHNDIKKEGEILKHCVATYAKRVATGETIILFVRKENEPDKPYFTLNINPDNYKMIQCRGLLNCGYPKTVKAFIDKWYQNVIEPLKRSRKQCLKAAS